MCQWSLQRVVDSVDLAFDYCLYCLLSVSLLWLTVLYASMNLGEKKW